MRPPPLITVAILFGIYYGTGYYWSTSRLANIYIKCRWHGCDVPNFLLSPWAPPTLFTDFLVSVFPWALLSVYPFLVPQNSRGTVPLLVGGATPPSAMAFTGILTANMEFAQQHVWSHLEPSSSSLYECMALP
jgi:hypothetical protein